MRREKNSLPSVNVIPISAEYLLMDRRFRLLLVLLATIGVLPVRQAYALDHRIVPGEAIIGIPLTRRGIANSSQSFKKLNITSFDSLYQEPISDSAIKVTLKRKAKSGQSFKPFSRLRSPCNAPSIKRLLRVSPSLLCEPNWEVKLTNTPNDTLLSSMYSASPTSAGKIFLPEAWDLSTGSSSIVVGIVDSGIDYNHPDLAANIWVNPSEIAANGIDDDSNGYIDDVHGYDFINQDSDPQDDLSHGTAVAGTIGSVGNNARGTVGINWNVKMIACKAFNSSGTGTVAAIASCLNYLVKLKHDYGINIRVTNNSYGGFPESPTLYNAIAATRDEGMVYVAGAGNDSKNSDVSPFYPASFNLDNIISVAAIDSSGALTSFSNYGVESVDIAAPGIGVYTTIPNNQYGAYQGTSIATPHVTGAIALLYAYHPEYVYSQAVWAIIHSGTVNSGLDQKCASSAILNVYQSLIVTAPTPVATATPTPISPPVDGGEIDLSTAQLDISKVKSKQKSVVTCNLSALRGATREGLPSRVVQLLTKGASRKSRATTSTDGAVAFKVRPPTGHSYKVFCAAEISDPATNEVKKVRSKVVSLMSARH